MSTASSMASLRPGAPASASVRELLDRARASLVHASQSCDAGDRYVGAHLGALRAAAAVVAARTSRSKPSRPRSVWELLPALAPELTEEAAFFAASGRQRAAIERGDRTLPVRAADDLLRQAEAFVGTAHDLLGVPHSVALPYLAPVTPPSRRSR